MVGKRKKRKLKKILTIEEKSKLIAEKNAKLLIKRENKAKKQYHDSIENIFTMSGFTSLPTENVYFDLSVRPRCELDHCFFYENVIVICEQKTGGKDTNHLIRKQETAKAILNSVESREEFLNHLTIKYKPVFDKSEFGLNRWKIFYLYFSKEKIEFSEEDKTRYFNLIFIDIATYNYFLNISKCIRKSFKYEIFRFLNLNGLDIGSIGAGCGETTSKRSVSIIYPDDVTGLNNGVGIVSFMMSPEELIKTSYVLRKDNWEDKIGLYQRLITEKRIREIRKFVIEKKRTFFNNIIVGLPELTELQTAEGASIDIRTLDRYENCKMKLPDGFNNISIIDGQHRVYAYFESNETDQYEKEVSILRKRLNLLVTGILFPKDWDDIKKRKFQSDIFLEINRNSKNVDKDLLIHIESTKDPFSHFAIARQTLEKLNKCDPFNGMFQLSLVEKSKIKVASIIQFALSYLVKPDYESNGFYKYWLINSKYNSSKILDNVDDLKQYVNYCSNGLAQYFSALKINYKADWENPKSQILKIVSLNGFIISLHRSLKLTNGVKDFEYYSEVFGLSNINFSKDAFPYSGSLYNKFATEVIDVLFFEKCETSYFEILDLKVGSELEYIEDKSIIAKVIGENMFEINGIKKSLVSHTKKILNTSRLVNVVGKYWVFNDRVLHSYYEEKELS